MYEPISKLTAHRIIGERFLNVLFLCFQWRGSADHLRSTARARSFRSGYDFAQGTRAAGTRWKHWKYYVDHHMWILSGQYYILCAAGNNSQTESCYNNRIPIRKAVVFYEKKSEYSNGDAVCADDLFSDDPMSCWRCRSVILLRR